MGVWCGFGLWFGLGCKGCDWVVVVLDEVGIFDFVDWLLYIFLGG